MDARLISAVLGKFSYEVDHEGCWWTHDTTPDEGSRVVIEVSDDEWESHSGLHTVDTTVIPAFRNRHGWTYYIVEPVADVIVGHGIIKVDVFKEVPEFTGILRKLDGTPASLSGDRIPNELAPLACRAGLQWFAWWINGEYHDEHGEPVKVMFVRGPATEQEATEWLAEWLEEKIPIYLAESL